jgi:hypothetical protein
VLPRAKAGEILSIIESRAKEYLHVSLSFSFITLEASESVESLQDNEKTHIFETTQPRRHFSFFYLDTSLGPHNLTARPQE